MSALLRHVRLIGLCWVGLIPLGCNPSSDEAAVDDVDDVDDQEAFDDSSGSGGVGQESEETGESEDELPEYPSCGEPDYLLLQCDDKDHDGVPRCEDNAAGYPNPGQEDSDLDGWGDVVDLCPLHAGDSNTGDSDKDGVGNDCDSCGLQVRNYNVAYELDPAFLVRNNPSQIDSDQDGVGDACDNCPAVANCGAFGPSNPPGLTDEIPLEDEVRCQRDENLDQIGDDCVAADGEALRLPGAAGPVGFDPADDFDQDGLRNDEDHCPRIVAARVSCQSDDECGPDQNCAQASDEQGLRYCNHIDADGDGVGNECDSCPYVANPDQRRDSARDDADGDFTGIACEHGDGEYDNPRPQSYHRVAVGGACCVTQYPGDGHYDMAHADPSAEDPKLRFPCVGLCDALGLPVRLDCPPEFRPVDPETAVPDGIACRAVPDRVKKWPGMVTLAPGCEQALADAGLCDPGAPDCADENANRRIYPSEERPAEELRALRCLLPPRDQDFDGLADIGDLCALTFDPSNRVLMDTGWHLWPPQGFYCNGEYGLTCAPALD